MPLYPVEEPHAELGNVTTLNTLITRLLLSASFASSTCQNLNVRIVPIIIHLTLITSASLRNLFDVFLLIISVDKDAVTSSERKRKRHILSTKCKMYLLFNLGTMFDGKKVTQIFLLGPPLHLILLAPVSMRLLCCVI